MRKSPLEQPRLSEIEGKLNEARFEEAQRLLAALPDGPGAESARVYFATRLLFERGRLDRLGVIERLRDLLRTSPDFPEAERMLQAAELGALEPSSESRRAGRTAPPATTDQAGPPSSLTAMSELAAIPRAPLVPSFGGRVPSASYSPPAPRPPDSDPSANHDTLLSPPPPSSAVDHEVPPAPSTRRDPDADLFELPSLDPPALDVRTLELPPLDDPPRRVPSLEPPPARVVVPRVPTLEIPAQRPRYADLPSTTPPEPSSTIPSPEPPPPSSRRDSASPPPTLLDITSALDQGAFEDAIRLADRAEPSPELSLLKARAFAKLDDSDGMERELRKLLRAPLLEPALRAATARLLIELGFPTRALEQARHALNDDPKDPMTRVTCAWALVRVEQRTMDAQLSRQAEPLLTSLRLRDPTLSALVPGLRAWVAAQAGDSSRALNLAQTALAQDPAQYDALAAIALASLKLGLFPDAERAIQKLRAIAPAYTADLEAAFQRAGLSLRRSERVSIATEASIAALFGDAETALVSGRPELAMLGFERACGDRLRALSRRGGLGNWATLAQAAARLFTELPVLRHFAPYDCSIFSVERLGAAFDVLFGSFGQTGFGDDSSVLLAGAYLGETLRQAFGGEWHGTPDKPRSASVEAVGLSLRPCEKVARSFRNQEPLSVEQPPHLHPAADPFGNSVPLSLVPPSPWDPEPWPSLQRVIEIGRLLPHSVVGAYCVRRATGELDHSVSGVVALDRYVNLLAPLKAPPALDVGWVRRASVFIGAYLGEVLVRAIGARWQEPDPTAGAAAYHLLLKDGTTTTPIARAFDRLSGRRVSPLSEYVARVVSGRTSIAP